METFDILIKAETFRITQNSQDSDAFSVFNHATFHIIKKNDCGIWENIEHRFGKDALPINEIGEAIDNHYSLWTAKPLGIQDIAEL
jgi:hypothetical protein